MYEPTGTVLFWPCVYNYSALSAQKISKYVGQIGELVLRNDTPYHKYVAYLPKYPYSGTISTYNICRYLARGPRCDVPPESTTIWFKFPPSVPFKPVICSTHFNHLFTQRSFDDMVFKFDVGRDDSVLHVLPGRVMTLRNTTLHYWICFCANWELNAVETLQIEDAKQRREFPSRYQLHVQISSLKSWFLQLEHQ